MGSQETDRKVASNETAVLQEIVTQCTAWHLARAKAALKEVALAPCVEQLITGLTPGRELYLPTGWKGHFVGICVHCCGDALYTRVDNRGDEARLHPSHPDFASLNQHLTGCSPDRTSNHSPSSSHSSSPNHSFDKTCSPKSHGTSSSSTLSSRTVKPCLLREDACTPEGISNLMSYLREVLSLPYDGSSTQNARKIYSGGGVAADPGELLGNIWSSGMEGRRHWRRLQQPTPLQTAENCAVATILAGMFVRMGGLAGTALMYQRVACLKELALLSTWNISSGDSSDEEQL